MLLFTIFIGVFLAISATAGLLPLRIEPDISTKAPPSKSQAYHGQVTKTGVAVIENNDPEDNHIHANAGYNDASTPSESITQGPHLAKAYRPQETGGQVNKSSAAVTMIDNEDGVLVDYYSQYKGNGSIDDGWPEKSSWISFQDLFNDNKFHFSRSCSIYHQKPNSEDETADIYTAIQRIANETLVDHRFILAIIMQESGGCVRAPTSNYGIQNPGVMQDHNGTATCNNGVDEDSIEDPCPGRKILQMVQEGVGGTVWGDGLAQCINKAEADDVSAFYRAARIYNSGSIHKSGDLGKGGATHCYASDVANRLTGWVQFEHRCDMDV